LKSNKCLWRLSPIERMHMRARKLLLLLLLLSFSSSFSYSSSSSPSSPSSSFSSSSSPSASHCFYLYLFSFCHSSVPKSHVHFSLFRFFVLKIGGLLELGQLQVHEIIPITSDLTLKLATGDDVGFTIELLTFSWSFETKHALQRNQLIAEMTKAQHISSKSPLSSPSASSRFFPLFLLAFSFYLFSLFRLLFSFFSDMFYSDTTPPTLSWLLPYLDPNSKFYAYVKTFWTKRKQQQEGSGASANKDAYAAVLFDDMKKDWIKIQMDQRKDKFTETKQLRVFVGTWNVGTQRPDDTITEWLRTDNKEDLDAPGSGGKIDMFVIGLQEIDMGAEALLLNDTNKSQPWEDTLRSAIFKVTNEKYNLVSHKAVLLLILLCLLSNIFRFIAFLSFFPARLSPPLPLSPSYILSLLQTSDMFKTNGWNSTLCLCISGTPHRSS
jgi:hypothetical protein